MLNQVEMRSFGPEFYKCIVGMLQYHFPFTKHPTLFLHTVAAFFLCTQTSGLLDYHTNLCDHNFVIEGEGSLAECGKEYRIGNLQARSDHYQNIFLFALLLTSQQDTHLS